MSLQNIYNFLPMTDRIATSGMPKPDHFSAMRAEGFEVVVNLALPTSDNALPNEGALVAEQAMTYVHIPVKFDAPQREDFQRFQAVMNAFAGRKVFVHCAANMRVTAFMFLYRVLKDPSQRAEAQRQMDSVWKPDEVWQKFMNSILG